LTHPNPGRCEPPPPPSNIVCSLRFDEPEEIEVGNEYTLVWFACNPDFGDTVEITPTIIAALGQVDHIEPGENCIDGQNADYTAPDDPGEETLTLDIEWPDSSTCRFVFTFTVVDENGD
jgi:hypothetical protein